MNKNNQQSGMYRLYHMPHVAVHMTFQRGLSCQSTLATDLLFLYLLRQVINQPSITHSVLPKLYLCYIV